MSILRTKDIEILDDRIEDIVKNADRERYAKVRPTLDEMWDIIFTVRDFVIEKKRKIYGGFALNKLLESVAPEDMIYDGDNIKDWDIDFYSPDPIGDAREIADRLYAKNYRFVFATEAQHEETYTVYAETMDCADISYVPKYIYNRIPFKEVDGMYLTGPHYMMIDYFRMITEPLTSYWRIQKSVGRLHTMEKHFPLPRNTSSIDIVPAEDNLDIAFRTVHEFFTDRESAIVVGAYAYDQYVMDSGITKRNQKGGRDRRKNRKSSNQTDIKLIPVNYYEAVSTSYKRDAKELIIKLREKFIDDGKLIIQEESYPFFQYLGYSVTIHYEEDVICKMYHYNHRCSPYRTVDAHYFGDKEYDTPKKGGKIQIGSFPMILLYNLIIIMKARTDQDNHTKNMYYTLNSHLLEMSNWYLDQNDKTIYDDTPFQYFILACRGEMLTPKMEKAIRIKRKKDANQKYTWRYSPDTDKDRTVGTWRFKNTSGNLIRYDKNLQINLSADDVDIDINIESEFDSDEEVDEQAEKEIDSKTTKARSIETKEDYDGKLGRELNIKLDPVTTDGDLSDTTDSSNESDISELSSITDTE